MVYRSSLEKKLGQIVILIHKMMSSVEEKMNVLIVTWSFTGKSVGLLPCQGA